MRAIKVLTPEVVNRKRNGASLETSREICVLQYRVRARKAAFLKRIMPSAAPTPKVAARTGPFTGYVRSLESAVPGVCDA